MNFIQRQKRALGRIAITGTSGILILLFVIQIHTACAVAPPEKSLPLTGQTLAVEGCTAFIIMPEHVDPDHATPWVWYAPTLPGLPEEREKWMFTQFLEAGIAIVGVDVGESHGSPQGRDVYSAFYKELVQKRGFSQKACLLARSRGGLMLYNWASENPDAVACIAGIYTVCNLRSYPGIDKACDAYGLTQKQLEAQLDKHNPLSRLAPLAKANVPIFHIHGDADTVVPLEHNSAELAKRYRKMGGKIQLQISKGQGHNFWKGFFQCQKLVDFIIDAAKSTDTKKIKWEVLFDGENLDAFNTSDLNGAWIITDKGELHAIKPGPPMIFTKKRYTDFVLELDFRIRPKTKANSGVFLHVHDKNQNVTTGMEVQILDNADYGVPFTAWNANGALYELVHPTVDANNPAGQWNHFRIVADHNIITVELNGIEIIRADMSHWTKAHWNPTGEYNKFDYAIGSLPREGFIGLQNYNASPVWFKNMRLQKLSDRKSKYTGNEPIDQVINK